MTEPQYQGRSPKIAPLPSGGGGDGITDSFNRPPTSQWDGLSISDCGVAWSGGTSFIIEDEAEVSSGGGPWLITTMPFPFLSTITRPRPPDAEYYQSGRVSAQANGAWVTVRWTESVDPSSPSGWSISSMGVSGAGGEANKEGEAWIPIPAYPMAVVLEITDTTVTASVGGVLTLSYSTSFVVTEVAGYWLMID